MEHNQKDGSGSAMVGRIGAGSGENKKNGGSDPLADALRRNLQRRKLAVRSVATTEE